MAAKRTRLVAGISATVFLCAVTIYLFMDDRRRLT
jgi:hypothetical protein